MLSLQHSVPILVSSPQQIWWSPVQSRTISVCEEIRTDRCNDNFILPPFAPGTSDFVGLNRSLTCLIPWDVMYPPNVHLRYTWFSRREPATNLQLCNIIITVSSPYAPFQVDAIYVQRQDRCPLLVDDVLNAIWRHLGDGLSCREEQQFFGWRGSYKPVRRLELLGPWRTFAGLTFMGGREFHLTLA
ncbi:hypothetical protein C8J57DRAFT_1572146 [Mycena rebaudengoi]|nr:hypothetical protein C8J57DRAFT_1572146 [Mycena rebaudengoi]